MEFLYRGFWWPEPWKFLKAFIKTCDVYARSKEAHHGPYGLLHPLPIPSRPWASLSMDFITDLPRVGGYDTVLVIFNWFSKMAHFVPNSKAISGAETADLFLQNVVWLHGLLEDVTSNRGSQFISHFWRRLLQTFETFVNLSTSYHPKTDGQTERVNQILKQYLGCTVNYQQDDCVDFLAMVEFTYYNSTHDSTRVSHSLQPMGSTLVSEFPFLRLRFPSIHRQICVPILYKMSIVTFPLTSMSLENSKRIRLTVIAWQRQPLQPVTWFGCYVATSRPHVPVRN